MRILTLSRLRACCGNTLPEVTGGFPRTGIREVGDNSRDWENSQELLPETLDEDTDSESEKIV